MSPFQRARPAPRELLLLASLNKKDRQLIDKTPNLRQAIETAHPTEWAAILERHHVAQQAARKATFSRGRKMSFEACGRSGASALRQQGMAHLRLAAQDYAALTDGRRNGLFEVVCGLGKYVVHEFISEDELRQPMREAACANGALEDHGEAWFDDCVTRALGYAQNDEPPALAKRSGSKTGVSIMSEDQSGEGQLLSGVAESAISNSEFDGSARSKASENPQELLNELNEKHAVLLQEGGKTLVLSWEKSEFDPGCEAPLLQSFPDFKNRYSNRRVAIAEGGKPKRVRAGDWWLAHPGRREYLGLRFLPGQPREVNGYLNLWRGFAVQPKPGCWSLMKEHVQQCLASGVEEHAAYILNWMAWLVQNPDRPAEVALVFKGGRGTGKGTFGRALKRLFGQHGIQVVSSTQLTGRFNYHLRDTCLLFADEAIAPGDKAAESVLKALITEPQLMIEGKGLNAIQVRNRLHIVMASNEDWVVPAGVDERRFAVFDVPNAVAQNREYFAALTEEVVNGGLEAMLQDLLSWELGDWHPREDVPQTDALLDQKAMSYRGFEAVFLDLLREGYLPGILGGEGRHKIVGTSNLRDYAKYVTKRRISLNAVAQVLHQLGFERRTSGRPRGFIVPPLPEAREAWDRYKAPVVWNDITEWVDADESEFEPPKQLRDE